MKHFIAAMLVLASTTIATLAQTCDELVSAGRTFMVLENLPAAKASFELAVTDCPDHEEANALLAGTRLLTRHQTTAGSNFLSRLGLPVLGRSLYDWTADLPADTNGVLLAPMGVTASEITAMIRTNLLLDIIASRQNLERITNTSFLLNLSSNETKTADVTLDYGDILLFRSMLHACEYFAYTVNSWNLDALLAAFREIAMEGPETMESLLVAHPDLLNYATTNDLMLAREAFVNAVDRYQEASAIIRSRPPSPVRLFNADELSAESEADFRQTLLDLKAALTNATPLSTEAGYTFFLAPHFSGQTPPRSFLPVIRGNRYGLGTLPDLTFGGVITGLTEDMVDRGLSGGIEAMPQLRGGEFDNNGRFAGSARVKPGAAYTLQLSTNLIVWEEGPTFVPLDWNHALLDPEVPAPSKRFYRLLDASENPPAPPNDLFDNRITITGLSVRVEGYNLSATTEPGEPASGFCPAGRTVWYRWTSPVTGNVALQSVGSPEFTPAIKVYTGNTLGTLTPVSVGGFGSSLTFNAISGVTYQIQVDGWCYNEPAGGFALVIGQAPIVTILSPANGAQFAEPATVTAMATASDPDGTVTRLEFNLYRYPWSDQQTVEAPPYTVSWTNLAPGDYSLTVAAIDNMGVGASDWRSFVVHPMNDNFAARKALVGSAAVINGTTYGSTSEGGEPLHAGAPQAQATVWYEWTAPYTGTATFLLESGGSWYPPILAVYTGVAVNALTPVTSAYDPFGGSPSLDVSFAAQAGTTYKIAVAAQYSWAGYDFSLLTLPTDLAVAFGYVW